jgi:hypothetical protein
VLTKAASFRKPLAGSPLSCSRLFTCRRCSPLAGRRNRLTSMIGLCSGHVRRIADRRDHRGSLAWRGRSLSRCPRCPCLLYTLDISNLQISGSRKCLDSLDSWTRLAHCPSADQRQLRSTRSPRQSLVSPGAIRLADVVTVSTRRRAGGGGIRGTTSVEAPPGRPGCKERKKFCADFGLLASQPKSPP